jgi:hypothetical protein
MSGRPKQRIYQYDIDGKFIQMYNSISEVKLKYFNNTQYPIFQSNKEYEFLEDSYFFKEKVGREKVRETHAIENSRFISKKKLIKAFPIEVYNLKGELLATFTSEFAMTVLTNISRGTVWNQLNNNRKECRKKGGLIFKKCD